MEDSLAKEILANIQKAEEGEPINEVVLQNLNKHVRRALLKSKVKYEKYVNAKDCNELIDLFKDTLCLQERGKNNSFYAETKSMNKEADLSPRVSNHRGNGNWYKLNGFMRLSVYFEKEDDLLKTDKNRNKRFDDDRFTELRFLPADLFSTSKDPAVQEAARNNRAKVIAQIFEIIKKFVKTGEMDLGDIDRKYVMEIQTNKSMVNGVVQDSQTRRVLRSRLADSLELRHLAAVLLRRKRGADNVYPRQSYIYCKTPIS